VSLEMSDRGADGSRRRADGYSVTWAALQMARVEAMAAKRRAA